MSRLPYDDAVDYDPGGSAYLRVCQTAELWQRRALAAVAVLAELAERDPSYLDGEDHLTGRLTMTRCSLCEARLRHDHVGAVEHEESCPWRVAYEVTYADE